MMEWLPWRAIAIMSWVVWLLAGVGLARAEQSGLRLALSHRDPLWSRPPTPLAAAPVPLGPLVYVPAFGPRLPQRGRAPEMIGIRPPPG
jgi:hypothetical protein